MLSIDSVWELVTQLYPTLCDPMDYRLPDFYVYEIVQARVLVWVAMPFSRGSSRLRDRTRIFYITGKFFTPWATILEILYWIYNKDETEQFSCIPSVQ